MKTKTSNKLLLLVCLLALVVISCGKKNHAQHNMLCTAVPGSDTVVFNYNTPVRIFESCTTALTPAITKIADSRCPKDVVCVWAGTASVDMELADGFSLTLEIGKQKDTIYDNRNYGFTLVDVIPYPVSQPPASTGDRKAIIRIVRQ